MNTNSIVTKDHKDAASYQKIQLLFSIISISLNLFVPIIFFISGASEKLRDFSNGIYNIFEITVLIYLVFFCLLLLVIQFPIEFLSGFIIEKKFKLNKQSLKSWIWDWIKASLMSNSFIILIVLGIYWLLENQQSFWWIWASISLSVLIIIFSALVPIFFLPLFYKFELLEEGELKTRLLKLAKKVGTNIEAVYVWHLGKKTSKSNAAVTGWGKTRRIIISDTLIQTSTEKEIEVVMAHELGHQVKKDIWKMILINIFLISLSFYLIHISLSHLIDLFNLKSISDIAGLPLIIFITAIISLLALPFSNWISRKAEMSADLFALKTTGMHDEFISAMNKLADQNLSKKNPNAIIEFIFYSHPSISKRIMNAKKFKELKN